MMGHSHAVSGAMVWLAGCTGLAALGAPATPWHVLAGTVVCAGAALLPDLDTRQSTVAHAAGPVTWVLAASFGELAQIVHRATKTRRDRPNGDGHRALTHTVPFAVFMGALASVACAFGGRGPVAVILGLMVALGMRGLTGAKRRARHASILVAVAAALAALWLLPTSGWWWMGIPIAVGCLVHDLGDATTNTGCPLLWPLLVRGQRWYLVGTPRRIRYRVGSEFEMRRLLPIMSGLAVAAGFGVVLV